MVHNTTPSKLATQAHQQLEAIMRSTEQAKRLYAAHGQRMAVMVEGRLAELDPVTDEVFFLNEPEIDEHG